MAIKKDKIGCKRICLNRPGWEKSLINGLSYPNYDPREDYVLGEYFKEAIEHKKKTDDAINDKCNYIPVCFRYMNHGFLLSLKVKEIAISGHIEPSVFNRIFVDVVHGSK